FNEEGPISWAPDGRSVLLTGNRNEGWQRDPSNSEIYQVSVTEAAMTPLTHRVGPDRAPRVSPDGRKIAYLGFDDHLKGYQNVRLTIMDLDGRNPHSVTDQLDRSIDDARWAADSHSLYVRYTDKAITRVARVSLDGRLQQIADGLAGPGLDRPYTGGDFS